MSLSRFKFPVSSFLLSLTASAAPPFFSVTDLGTLGGRESRAYAVNAAGHVAGASASASGAMRAFRWTPEAGMTDLGTLGGATSRAHDLNDAGAVVGEAEGTNGLRQPFHWTLEEGLRALVLPPGAAGGVAQAINAAGRVIGAVDFADGPCGVLWPTPTNAPLLLTATGMAGVAFGIDAAGWVVGQAEMGAPGSRVTLAFRRDPDGVVAGLAAMPEGLSSAARAINSNLQVAGWQELASGITHAFLFDENGLRDLDTRNNVYSSAQGLNAHGEVVGTCFNGPDDDAQGFLCTDDGFYLLDDLLDTRENLLVTEAWDITDDRRIAACALKDGRERALLLTPLTNSAGTLPAIRLLEPAPGTRMALGQPVALVAEAAAAGGIKRVLFYANGQIVGQSTEAPYRVEWVDPPAGDADLVARAVSKHGLENESARVRIRIELPTNAFPVATWLEPADQTALAPGANLLLRATGADPDGRVVVMELWKDGMKIAEGEGSELGEAWPAAEAGSHAFLFVAEDERGGRGTSEVRRIVVEAQK